MNPELSFAATASLPRERANAKARRELPLFHELRERLLDPAPRAVPDLLRHVAHDRLAAGCRGDLRNAASHQATPQHPHTSYLGHTSPGSGLVGQPRGGAPALRNALRNSSAIRTKALGWEPGRAWSARISPRSSRSSTCSSPT